MSADHPQTFKLLQILVCKQCHLHSTWRQPPIPSTMALHAYNVSMILVVHIYIYWNYASRQKMSWGLPLLQSAMTRMHSAAQSTDVNQTLCSFTFYRLTIAKDLPSALQVCL